MNNLNSSLPSVSTLEFLVPSLDLCKQIPEGQFSRSVFVWSYSCDKRKTEPFLDERDCIEFCRRDMVNAPPVYPAPTLQEILAEFHNFHLEKFGKDNPCSIIVKRDPENFSPAIENHSAVTAALQLWLELNSIPSIPSIPTAPEVLP